MTAHRWRAWGSKHGHWRWRCPACGDVSYYVEPGGKNPAERPTAPNLPQTTEARDWTGCLGAASPRRAPSRRAVAAWCRENNVTTAWGWYGGAQGAAPAGHRPPDGKGQGWAAAAHDDRGRLRGWGYGETREEARADLMRRVEEHGPIGYREKGPR